MQFCIVRNPSLGGRTKAPFFSQGTLLQTRRLTIGSSPAQHLQLASAGVDEHHAIVSGGLLGRPRIRSLSPRGFLLNGRRVQEAWLRTGDFLQIGGATLGIRHSKAERLWVIVIDEQSKKELFVTEEPELIDAPLPVVRIASWSVSLVLGISILFLVLPMSGVYLPKVRAALRNMPFVPSDSSWSPGSLHAAHQSIGTRCEACHAKPFKSVRNEECLTCHADVHRHVNPQETGVTRERAPGAASAAHERCITCHLEHSQPAALVQRDQRLCSDCHADLANLKPTTNLPKVTDFDTDHPEFRMTTLIGVAGPAAPFNWQMRRLDRADPAGFAEHSHLRFSHRKHLDPAGIKSPQGDRVLACADCHRPDASGRYMRPIQMETQCASCHSLMFDEHDPSTAVPHGNLQAVFKKLQEHFSSQFLSQHRGYDSTDTSHPERPGGNPDKLTQEDEKRARAWVDQQSLRIARELLEKRVCADCHEVTRDNSASGLQQWRIVPVRLTAQWMPRAQFDHSRHASQKCTSCHDTAINSDSSTDVLMPRIAQCRECHGGVAAAAKVASDCVMCHAFHLKAREPWVRTAGRGHEPALGQPDVAVGDGVGGDGRGRPQSQLTHQVGSVLLDRFVTDR